MSNLIRLSLADAEAILLALPEGAGADLRRLIELARKTWMGDDIFLEVGQAAEMAGMMQDPRLRALLARAENP